MQYLEEIGTSLCRLIPITAFPEFELIFWMITQPLANIYKDVNPGLANIFYLFINC